MPNSLRFCAPALGALCLVVFSACASAPRAAPQQHSTRDFRAPSEPVALSVLDRLLIEQRQLPVEGWRVRLDEGDDLEVDLRLGSSHFGIEWVSARDRQRGGAALPEPDPGGQLRVVSASEASGPVQILVLDARSYARDASESAWQSERVLEQRLRADVQDFIAYAFQ